MSSRPRPPRSQGDAPARGRLSGLKSSFRRGTGKAPLPPGAPPPMEDEGDSSHERRHHHMHVHLPHFHRHRVGSSDFFFDDDAHNRGQVAEDDEDDSVADDDTASQVSMDSVEKGKAKKVKGGIKGAGAAGIRKITDARICERLFMAFLAVSLLWLTSYALARALVKHYVRGPAFANVQQTNYDAYEDANAESALFVECVEEAASACRTLYDDSFGQENNKRLAAQALNADRMAWLDGNLTKLSDVFNQTILALSGGSYAFKSGVLDSNNNNYVVECAYVDGLIQGDAAALDALKTFNDYKASADLAVQNRAAQLYALRLYNEAYLANKTAAYGSGLADALRNPEDTFSAINASVAGFKACFVPNATGCPTNSAFDQYRNSFDQAVSQFDNINVDAQAYKVKMKSELDKFALLIDDLEAVNAAAGFNLISTPSSNRAENPSQLNQVFSLIGIKDPEASFAKAEGFFSDLDDSIGATNAAEQANYDDIAAGSDITQVLPNYDPPPAPPGEGDSWQQYSDAFAPGVATKLGALDSATGDQQNGAQEFTSNTTANINSTSDVVLQLKNHSAWDFFVYSDDIINDVSAGVEQVDNIILMCDTAFRILHTLFIIRKYWNLSGLRTPAGDARVKASAGKGWGPKQTPFQKVAAIVTNPAVLAFVFTSFTVLLLWCVWYMYSPLYYKYVDGCLESTPADINAGRSEGTLFYRNGYEVTYLYAAADGDKLALEAVDELNRGRELTCSQLSFDDTVLFNDNVRRYNRLANELNKIAFQNGILQQCLQVPPGLAAGSGELVTDLISTPEYLNVHPEPDADGIYNCSAVDSCPAIRSTTPGQPSICAGPLPSRLQSKSHQAACTTESWLHANMWGAFMTVAIFLCMNLGRLFFMRGVVRLSWRHIIPAHIPFSFLGSCDDYGRVIYPERVTEKGDSMRHAIAEALKLRIRQWERWGYLILFSGIALQAPWIYGLWFLDGNLDYTENRE